MSFVKKNLAALLLLVLGVGFLAIGTLRGETETIYRKAVNVCMECIGLG